MGEGRGRCGRGKGAGLLWWRKSRGMDVVARKERGGCDGRNGERGMWGVKGEG